MLGISQQDGGCKKSSPARATLKVVRRSICTIVLLTITAVTGATGVSDLVTTVGDSSVLTCPTKGQISMLIWTINPKAGGSCTLVYRTDKNMTSRTNCSDNIKWKFRAGLAPALEIQQVGIAQEGSYSCEEASTEGNFHTTYHLTVLAPPRLSLYCDEQGSPVCEAAAGKPPAQLSWVPESSSRAEKCHDNGTVTVLSKFTACSTNGTNVTTCMVSHPSGNWSQSIACCPSEESGCFLHCVISLTSLMSLLFLTGAFQLYIFFNRYA
ncbi:cell surface glycoprotein CD200 receptor 1-B-like [Chamaea fasciata]|uniref:cell surface glycoprotein CD200 receptor 1-B-like n=1 Tax=Chamaea fasciata TaxID=190680 RepID=UPI00336AA57D